MMPAQLKDTTMSPATRTLIKVTIAEDEGEGEGETGDLVERGGIVGDLAIGGHADVGTLHLGARLHGEYINPLLLLGGVPRAILLPCC